MVAIRAWKVEGAPEVGEWQEAAMATTIGDGEKARTYMSDWLPVDKDGKAFPMTHSGTYLKIKVAGGWEYFHRQLSQDRNRHYT